jgi:hypothetical protein
MNDDPIVSEVRRVREALWHEAGCDLNRLAELVHQTVASVSPTGPSIENAQELRRYVEQQQTAAAALREDPPAYGEDLGKS